MRSLEREIETAIERKEKRKSRLAPGEKIKLSRVTLEKILETAVEYGASDIFLSDQRPVVFKILGNFYESEEKLPDKTVRTFFAQQLEQARKEMERKLPPAQRRFGLPPLLQADFRLDFSEDAFFRVNYYRAFGRDCAVFRLLKKTVRDLSEINVAPQYEEVLKEKDGLVVISGPTGSGKTTTLSAILNRLIQMRVGHYITLEDPIELYLRPVPGAVISQRELGKDVESFEEGLKAAMREAPDVVLVGETRDYPTLKLATHLAETGHLVFTTFHANNCIETIIRLSATVPENDTYVRFALVFSLKYVLSQRLVRTVDGQMVPICEFLPIREEVRSFILRRKFQELKSLFESYGGLTFTRHLREQMKRFEILPRDIEITKRLSSVQGGDFL